MPSSEATTEISKTDIVIGPEVIRTALKKYDHQVSNNPFSFDLKIKNNLFRIYKDGFISHILPTCHLSLASGLSDSVLDIINSSDSLVTESAGYAENSSDMKDDSSTQEEATLEDVDIHWHNELSHIEKEQIKKILNPFYLPEFIFDFNKESKAEILSQFYSILLYDHSMDLSLVRFFEDRGVFAEELDSHQQQEEGWIDMTNDENLYDMENLKKVLAALNGEPLPPKDFNSIKYDVEMYCHGILPESCQDKNTTQRNHAWLPKIVAQHHSPGKTLFAFGAAHLGGKQGVLELLMQNGFQIEKMDEAGNFIPYPPFPREFLPMYRKVLSTIEYESDRVQQRMCDLEQKVYDISIKYNDRSLRPKI